MFFCFFLNKNRQTGRVRLLSTKSKFVCIPKKSFTQNCLKKQLKGFFLICFFVLFLWSAETDNSQRVLDNDSAQHLKMRDRQRFFEEVYQHDMDNYLPSAHLQIDCRKRQSLSITLHGILSWGHNSCFEKRDLSLSLFLTVFENI